MIIQAFVIASINQLLFKRYQVVGLAYMIGAVFVSTIDELLMLTYWLLAFDILASMMEVIERK